MIPNFPRPILHGAYLIVTMSIRTKSILRVGIYSSPAEGLTSDMMHETNLNGPKVESETYEKARKQLLKLLKSIPTYQWLYDMLPARDKA